jgi:ABC-type dipeptide/oligopeptide/nickel transport system permease subunit
MAGGFTLLVLALSATIAGFSVGMALGLIAGLRESNFLTTLIMRGVDIFLAFPGFVLLLLLVAAIGAGPLAVFLAVAILHVPGSARVTRAATVEVAQQTYIQAAWLRGERRLTIAVREVLPNISGVVAADFGTRLSLSILVIAGANFLGLGLQPPTPDWGIMIAENRVGLYTQPLSVVAPAALIAFLTISLNLTLDVLVRRMTSRA